MLVVNQQEPHLPMSLNNDLRDVQQRVIELYAQAEQFFRRHLRMPYIRLDLTGSTAGQAWPQKHLLRFNPVLLRENRADFLRQTVAHEVAHLLAHDLYGPGIRPHGRQWKSIMMTVFGLPAQRCHQYDTSRSSRKEWLYRCQCDDKVIPLSTVRHNRAQKGTIYLCRCCKAPLIFQANSPAKPG